MSSDPPKSWFLSPAVHEYLVAHGTPPDALLEELARETREVGPLAMMQVAPEQGAFLTFVTRLVGARRAIEVGTFTGYSSICIARGLPSDGKLLCCDVNEAWAAVARRYWAKAGLSERIELRLAPAAETLSALPLGEPWDLAFIDADKPGYPVYYEEILKRLRPGGLILVDNVLWMGRVADTAAQDPATAAIRAFNDLVAGDVRVDKVMLPLSDGLTLLRKRP
jgi:caffeoyl-CoA O-methyltransferase